MSKAITTKLSKSAQNFRRSKIPIPRNLKQESISPSQHNRRKTIRFLTNEDQDRANESTHQLLSTELQRLDQHNDNHANERFNCNCPLCDKETKILREKFERGKSAEFYIENESQRVRDDFENDFVFVLKHLVAPKNVQRSLRIFIPDTVAFNNSNIIFICFTGRVIECRLSYNF